MYEDIIILKILVYCISVIHYNMVMATKMTRSSTEKTDIIETMTKLLDTKLDPITEKLSKLATIETSVGYALDEIRKISELENNVKSIKTDITGLVAENSKLQAENTALEEQLLR